MAASAISTVTHDELHGLSESGRKLRPHSASPRLFAGGVDSKCIEDDLDAVLRAARKIADLRDADMDLMRRMEEALTKQ